MHAHCIASRLGIALPDGPEDALMFINGAAEGVERCVFLIEANDVQSTVEEAVAGNIISEPLVA